MTKTDTLDTIFFIEAAAALLLPETARFVVIGQFFFYAFIKIGSYFMKNGTRRMSMKLKTSFLNIIAANLALIIPVTRSTYLAWYFFCKFHTRMRISTKK